MKVLVINAGSSSIKFQMIDTVNNSVMAKGLLQRIGEKSNAETIVYKTKTNEFRQNKVINTFEEGVEIIKNLLTDKKMGVLKNISEIEAVGHRVVQGAEIFKKSTLITKDVIKKIENLTPLAPLHQPGHIAGMNGFIKALPNVPMVAVFDTVFHTTIPDYASRYAIPEVAYKKWKIKRYGAHGTSHKYVSQKLEEILGRKGKFIICHIGNGASISAVKNGKCIDTSMGFTPLEGLVMGTRSGDIEPTVVTRIMDMTGKTAHEVVNYLNKECGLLGVSELSNDRRDLEIAAKNGNKKAELAIKMEFYRIKKYIGAYAAILGGVDAIAFTAGAGENGPEMRENVLDGLEFMGIKIDKLKNINFKRGIVQDITDKNSKTKIFIIPTDEEGMIAKETEQIVSQIIK